MFVHQHHLRNLLRPEHYTAEDHHRLELDRLFRPVWHPVGVLPQLARHGNVLTFNLFGTPVVIRNDGGELRAFLDAHPHRRDRLSDLPRFRVGTWGQVVFVSLADDGPPLAEFLAPAREHWADGFGPPFRYSMTWFGDFACDWKVVLENALETYHVPELHARTFKEMVPEPDCEHDLKPHYTFFEGKILNDWMTRRMNELVGRLGMPVTGCYRHLLIHPHVQFSRLDVYRMVQAVYPTGPRTCRYWNFMFTLWGKRGGPLRWVQARILRWVVNATALKVFGEDGSIYAAVQRGLSASPFPGVIGTREERIYPFQEFVLRGCGLPTPPDPGAADVTG